MNKDKLCIECDFFRMIEGKECCTHSASTSVKKDLIVGMRRSYDSCHYQRAGGLCGPAGYNFKRNKKPPIGQFETRRRFQ